ncbi:MAG: hypothetical protein GKR93_02380 [Gammaproteobacteria bacterium]|nr:hypothetical protein [Gammaproteobacteria bacterium]
MSVLNNVMKNIFEIGFYSVFVMSTLLLLSPLQAQQTSPDILKSKISEYLSDDKFSSEKINEIIDDSQCSVQQAATVAAVLVSIKKPRLNQQVFSWSLDADDDNECLRRTGIMELAWDYRRRKKISSMWISNDQLYWRDTGGSEGVPIVADNLLWTNDLEKTLAESKSIHKVAWASGQVSDEAAAELRNRGITLSANRFNKSKGREKIVNDIFGLSEASEPEPVSAPIAQEAEQEIPAPQQIEMEKETIVAVQEPEPVSEPVVVEQNRPPVTPPPSPEPEKTKEVVVKGPDCWEHPRLGRFIFEKNGRTTEMTHEIPAPGKSRHFTLTSIGNQLYWKTNKVEHVFLIEKNKASLFINIHNGNKETELTACE